MTNPTEPPPMLVHSDGGAWATPEVTTYAGEVELQGILGEQPHLLPTVGEGARAVRELPTAVGPIDICIVDDDGRITIVECKLASNAEIRRKIVGQVVDYASQLWKLPFDEFDQKWRLRNDSRSLLDDDDDTDLRSAVERNLAEGRFDLVLAVDSINDHLKRIVEYVNAHTSPEMKVFAFELGYAKHAGVEILVPAVYGLELARVARPAQEKWNPSDTLDWLAANDPALPPLVAELFTRCEQAGIRIDGTAAHLPSAIMHVDVDGKDAWPICVYCGPTTKLQLEAPQVHRHRRISATSSGSATSIRPSGTPSSTPSLVSPAPTSTPPPSGPPTTVTNPSDRLSNCCPPAAPPPSSPQSATCAEPPSLATKPLPACSWPVCR